jgi:hypothetical protein
VDEVGQIFNLSSGVSGGFAGLGRMVLFENGSDLIAVAIAEDDDGADKIGSVLRATGARAMAGDALGRVDFLPALGCFLIHDVLIG